MKKFFPKRENLHGESADALGVVLGFAIAAILFFTPDFHEWLLGSEYIADSLSPIEVYWALGFAALFAFLLYYGVMMVPTKDREGRTGTKGYISIGFSSALFLCVLVLLEGYMAALM